METRLGKISAAKFGAGGYDDAQFGVTFDLAMGNTHVGDFWGVWQTSIKPGDRSEWSEADRVKHRAGVMLRIEMLMADAEVSDFSKLVGVPVEVTFEGVRMTSWRVLAEVL